MAQKLTLAEKNQITELYPYLIEKVQFYERKFPYLAIHRREEIYDYTLDGFIYAITHFDNSKGASLKTYISIKTNFKLIDLLRKKDDITNILKETDMPDNEKLEDWLERDEGFSEREYFEMEDIFKNKGMNDRERLICLNLARGYTQRNIAKMLKVSNSRVSQIVSSLKKYFIKTDKGGKNEF